MRWIIFAVLIIGLVSVTGCGCAKSETLLRLKSPRQPCPNPSKVKATVVREKQDWTMMYTNYNYPFSDNQPTPLPAIAGFTPYMKKQLSPWKV